MKRTLPSCFFFPRDGSVGWCHHAFFPRDGSEKTFPSCSVFHGMGPKILEILKFRPLKFSFINTNVYLKNWPVVLRKKKTLVKYQLKIIFVFLQTLKIKIIFNISFYHQIKLFNINIIYFNCLNRYKDIMFFSQFLPWTTYHFFQILTYRFGHFFYFFLWTLLLFYLRRVVWF
jgi:hypothetical protein